MEIELKALASQWSTMNDIEPMRTMTLSQQMATFFDNQMLRKKFSNFSKFYYCFMFFNIELNEKKNFNLKTNQKKAVIVDEEEIYVNKLLLLNFPYFKAMFNISMSEQQSNQVGFKKINMIHELIVFSFIVKS